MATLLPLLTQAADDKTIVVNLSGDPKQFTDVQKIFKDDSIYLADSEVTFENLLGKIKSSQSGISKIVFISDPNDKGLKNFAPESFKILVQKYPALTGVKELYFLGDIENSSRLALTYRDVMPRLNSIQGYTSAIEDSKSGEKQKRPFYYEHVTRESNDSRAERKMGEFQTIKKLTFEGDTNLKSSNGVDSKLILKMAQTYWGTYQYRQLGLGCIEANEMLKKISGVSFFTSIPEAKIPAVLKYLPEFKKKCPENVFDEPYFSEFFQAESREEIQDREQWLESRLVLNQFSGNFSTCAKPLIQALGSYIEKCRVSDPQLKETMELINKTRLTKLELEKLSNFLGKDPSWENSDTGSCGNTLPPQIANHAIFCALANLNVNQNEIPDVLKTAKIEPNDPACKGISYLNDLAPTIQNADCGKLPKIEYRGWTGTPATSSEKHRSH